MNPRYFDIITDCAFDSNGRNRLWLRATRLCDAPVHVVSVASPLQAAGNLVDALDQVIGIPGIILVNIAPRHGEGKKWENGTPFGYFWVDKTLVVSTIADQTLSLVHKLGLAADVHVFDIPTVMEWAIREGHIGPEEGERIIHTQFRSLTFQPLVSTWVAAGYSVPSETVALASLFTEPLEPKVWEVDHFGNCKTTVLESDVRSGRIAALRSFDRLRSVPEDGEPAVIVGSSGYGNKRFCEIVVQGKSAAEHLGFDVGSTIG